MPTKGERTKASIVAAAAPLFNERGFAGTSMNDILDATGLEKGGVYRHFESKDAVALAAFDYALAALERRRRRAVDGASTARERLLAGIAAFGRSLHDPVLRGGCPILNTAIDADDTHPALRSRAHAALERWQRGIAECAAQAQRDGDLDPTLSPDAIASVVTSALEGAIMVSRLTRDQTHMLRVVEHLTAWLGSRRAPSARTAR